MDIRWHKTRDPRGIYEFLKESFPHLTYYAFQKVVNGQRFSEWIYGEINNKGKYTMICCAAIFTGKMGLFCVAPHMRRKGVGKIFYNMIMERYKHLTWTAVTEEAILFYRRMGAKENGGYTLEGKRYTSFQN